MRALFLSWAYPPGRFPRAIQVARLARYSRHEIEVVCADDGSPRDPSIPAADPARVRVRTLPDRHVHSLVLRLLRHATAVPDPQRAWALAAARDLVTDRIGERVQVLVTFGQPMSDHLAGLTLRRHTGLPWIAHFSDPWSDNPFHLPVPFARRRNRRLEWQVAEAANRLVFTSEETRQLVMRKYPRSWQHKGVVLPHAFDPALYGSAVPAADDTIRIRYLGNFYRQRNPRALVGALRLLLQSDPDLLQRVEIELVGRWVGQPNPAALADGLPTGLLRFHPPVDYLESIRLMESADLLLVMDAPNERSVFFPSKLADYIGARRPLLAFTPPGCSASMVHDAGGWIAPPDRPDLMARTLSETLQALRQGKVSATDPRLLDRLAAPRVAATFDALLESVAKEPRQL